VHRILPVAQRRSVGPFVFFDQMGPATLAAGHGMDVRPHPHIGLATVTYLFQGEILHRDSLGSVQVIRPGDVNWMTAGSGIAHSERSPEEFRTAGGAVFGIQSWVALPKAHEEADPGFFHHGVASLPRIEGEGKAVRIIAGTAFGQRAPVATFSETLYCDVVLKAGAKIEVPLEHEERAIQPVTGKISVAGHAVEPGSMLVLRAGAPVVIEALEDARLMLVGGEPLDGPRNIWWNFVSSSRDRMEQAKADWKAGRFGPVPGETEFIPLPE
jgi:redox-sensitive bicupin YhaK (pirin superfamily)